MRIQESQRMALPRWSKALSHTSINFVIGQAPDNQLRGETKELQEKLYTDKIRGRVEGVAKLCG